MKFFQGYDKLVCEDIMDNAPILDSGRCRTAWGQSAPINGTWRRYANGIVVTDVAEYSRGQTLFKQRLLHKPCECENAMSGNSTNGWRCDEECINLKYVPQKIKNADYDSITDYLNAVMEFINSSKAKAKGKLLIQKHNNQANAALNFLDAQTIIEDVTKKAGWFPTPADAWLKKHRNVETLNELYKKQGRTEFEYQKDRIHKLKFEVQKSKKNLAKLTITGLDAERSQEILTALFGFLA